MEGLDLVFIGVLECDGNETRMKCWVKSWEIINLVFGGLKWVMINGFGLDEWCE